MMFTWVFVGANLFRWDAWLKSRWAFQQTSGHYTLGGALLYASIGLLLIVLRQWPPGKMIRREAYAFLVGKSLTARCSTWYKPYATPVVAKWADSSMTVIYSTLALKFVCRIVPWAVDLSRLLVPSLDFLLGVTDKLNMHAVAIRIMKLAMTSIAIFLFGRMLLVLKSPPAAIVPRKTADVMRGSAIPWTPLMWFLATTQRPKLRKSRMRLLLVDKCLTLAICVFMTVPFMNLLHIKVQTVLAVGGVGGLALGLAMQNLVQNLIAGILIYINASICEGLEVELVDTKLSGVVSSVGWLNTSVNRYDGMRVLVPNRRVLDGTVVDKTNKCFRLCDEQVLVQMKDSRSFDELVSSVETILRDHPAVLQEDDIKRVKRVNNGALKLYEPQFVFQGWSEYGAKFRVRAYFDGKTANDVFIQERSELLLKVNRQINALDGRVGFNGFLAASYHGSRS